MISPLFLKICRWRFSLLHFSMCSFFKWNSEQDKIEFQNFANCRIFCAVLYGFNLLIKATLITYSILNYMFIKIENGKQEIFDVTNESENKYDQTLVYICHSMNVGILILLLGCWTRLVQNRDVFLKSINLTLASVLKYQGNIALNSAFYYL